MKNNKREYVIETLGINNLSEEQVLQLIEYDNKFLKYIDVDKLILNGYAKNIIKCIGKDRKMVSKINVYNADILRYIIFNKDTKYDDIQEYKNRCNLTLDQRRIFHILLIEFVDRTITSLNSCVSKKACIKASQIMCNFEALMPKFNYNPMDVKLNNKAMFVQLYKNGDDEKKLILLRRYRKHLDYNTMYKIGLVNEIKIEE